MVAAYPTSDRQPLRRGCDVDRILRYCQTGNRSNTSRDAFRHPDYAFVLLITRQTRTSRSAHRGWKECSWRFVVR